MIATFPDKRSQARAPKSKIGWLLEDMPLGSSGAIKGEHVVVDSAGYIWAMKRAPVIAGQEGSFSVGISRDEAGQYHLDYTSKGAQLQRFACVDRKLGKHEVPIASVVWE